MKTKRLFRCLVSYVGFAILLLSSVVHAGENLRLAITDLEGMEQMQREFGAFRKVLIEKTKLDIDFFAVPNRTAAVEAMRAKRVELVLTGPAEYVIFKTRTDARPIAGFSRPDYFADIIVLADSGITSVRDLKGHKVGLGDVGSTSKHLAPMQILKDNGLVPGHDVQVVHISSVKTGWEALKRGDIKAFGTTDDKFLRLRQKEKTLPPGAFRVIARSGDLPNDVLLVRPDINQEIVANIQNALREHEVELVAAIITGEDNQKYKGMKFLTGIKDGDYDAIREMYRTAGYPQFSKFVGE